MRTEKLPRALLCAAAILILAAAALFPRGEAGARLRLPDGGRAVLYGTQAAPAAVTVTEEDGHSHTLDAGGTASAVLLLRSPGDRGGVLAKELTRRGLTVLAADARADAAQAWDLLVSDSRVRLSSVALICGAGRGAEALELAAALTGGGREPAAVILCGAGLPAEAAGSPARNVLILATDEPEQEPVEAFLGEEERRPGWIGGYFAEGSARAVVRNVPARWTDQKALIAAIDWLGSSLGHAVELPDDDLPALGEARRQSAAVAAAAAGAVLAGAAGALYLKRRNDRRDRHDDK